MSNKNAITVVDSNGDKSTFTDPDEAVDFVNNALRDLDNADRKRSGIATEKVEASGPSAADEIGLAAKDHYKEGDSLPGAPECFRLDKAGALIANAARAEAMAMPLEVLDELVDQAYDRGFTAGQQPKVSAASASPELREGHKPNPHTPNPSQKESE